MSDSRLCARLKVPLDEHAAALAGDKGAMDITISTGRKVIATADAGCGYAAK